MKITTLTSKISIMVTVLTILVLLATLLTVYINAHDSLKREAEDETQYKLDLMIERLEKVQATIELSANYSLQALHASMTDTAAVMSILTNIVEKNQYVNCAAVAYAPDRMPGHTYYMPTAANEGIINNYYTTKEINGEYIYSDWYIVPSLKGVSYWTDPYYNDLKIPVISYAVPITSNEHGFEGVLTVAVELTNLNQLISFEHGDSVASLHNHGSHDNVLFDSHTTFLSSPHTEYIMNETLFTLAELQNDTVCSYVGREILANRNGLEIMVVEGEKSVVAWRKIPKLQWTAMVIMPYTEVFAELNNLTYITIGVAAMAVILAVIILFLAVRRALRSMKRLQKATRLLGEGKYDTELPHKLTSRKDEIGDLGREFMRMEKAVKNTIKDLEEERKRVQSSNETLNTLIHNVVSHLQMPINNMLSFTDGLAALVDDTEEAKVIKNEAQSAGIKILQQFNQLNEMANLVTSDGEDADSMIVVPSNEFVDGAIKGAYQLEDRFFLSIHEEYRDKRKINIRTNTLTLETLLYQLIIEAAKVSNTNEIGLYSMLNKEETTIRLMIEAKTDHPIPDDEKATFFRRFAEKKINAYAGSDYLQLFICYRTAKHLGARIYVDADYKKGNLFVIEIQKAQ